MSTKIKHKTIMMASREAIEMILKMDGIYKIKNDLPKDAKLIGWSYIPDRDEFDFVFECPVDNVWNATAEASFILRGEFWPSIEKIGERTK